MSPRLDGSSTRAMAALLVGIGFALRAHHAWLDAAVPDDTFQLLTLARDVARGQALATNAVSPLGLAVLVPLFRFLPRADPWTVLHVAQTVGSLFELAGCVVLHRLTGALGLRPFARLLVLGLVTLGSTEVARSTSGVSLPLATLLLTLLLYACTRASRGARIGVLAGLATLASAELALVALVAGLCGVRRQHRPRMLAGFALIVLPWLLLSIRFHHLPVPAHLTVSSIVTRRLPLLWGTSSTGMSLQRAAAALLETSDGAVRALGVGRRLGLLLLGATAALLVRPSLRVRVRLHRIAPFVAAVVLASVVEGVGWMVPTDALQPAMLVALALLVGIAVDRLLRVAVHPRAVAAALAVSVLFAIAARDPVAPLVVPKPAVRIACVTCSAAAYFHPGSAVPLAAPLDLPLLEAIERGALVDELEKRAIERVELDERWLHGAIAGAHHRERLCGDHLCRGDEKQRAQLSTTAGRDLATGARELLSDGWLWPATPTDSVWSAGRASELVTILPATPHARRRLQIELQGVIAQPIDVLVDGARVATLAVTPAPKWFDIPLVTDVGPVRVTFVPSRIVERREDFESWWRAARGAHGAAFRARRVRHLDTSVPALPPRGPSLSVSEGALVLSSGFFPVERDAVPPGVWAQTESAVIAFWVDDAHGAHRFVLEAGPPPSDDAGADQTVTLLLGEREIATVVLPPSVISRHEIEVPEGALVAGENRLTLRVARLATDATGLTRALYLRSLSLSP